MSEITKHESMEEFYARTKAEEESAYREAMRDGFAGLALQGLLANPAMLRRYSDRPRLDMDVDGLARWCYDLSDAMLAARESKP